MYDIKLLTEFNHALIYGFEPEASPARSSGSEKLKDTLIPEAHQHEDMLNAYLFAQNEILPYLKTNDFRQITPDLFLAWIKKLHQLIGKSLLEEHHASSGEFSNRMILRWHAGAHISLQFISYFSGLHACKSDSAFALYLHEEFEVDLGDVIAFINLLQKLQKNDSIKIHKTEILDFEKNPDIFKRGLLVINRLGVAYNSSLLNSDEKKSVDKIVKTCMYPEAIAQTMEIFVKDVIKGYQAVDKKNINQVVEFISNTFYQFTDIHPFPNANGRTATCLLNILLRSFDLPSILLRYPGDKADKKSLYSRAIEQIDQSRALLQELIKLRITEAQHIPFNDPKLAKTILLRVGVAEILNRIRSKHPHFNIETIHNAIYEMPLWNQMDSATATIFLLACMINVASYWEKKLDAKAQPVTHAINFPRAPITDEDARLLIANLNLITAKTGWRLSLKEGILAAWIEIPSETEAKSLYERFANNSILTAKLMRRKDNKVTAIICENIQVEKLNNHVIGLTTFNEGHYKNI